MSKALATLGNISEVLRSGLSDFTFQNPALISVPNTTILTLQGTPRKMSDPTKTIRPILGVERIWVRGFHPLLTEKGNLTTGENVYELDNKDERIRLVGTWTRESGTSGQYVQTVNANDYVEISFYGTGLNLLEVSAGSARDYRYTLDGGAESANIFVAHSSVLTGQNWEQAQIRPVVSGLSRGHHTVKIRCAATLLSFCGFEIIDSTGNIGIPSGEIIDGGLKFSNGSFQTLSYNTGFDGSPVLNGRGGRVVVYMTREGRIGKVITQVDSSSLFLNNANHANEEVINMMGYREYGRSRGDDFNTFTTTRNAYYTLDDNSHALSGQGVAPGSGTGVGTNASGDFLNWVFVGTGLDIYQEEVSGTFSGTQEIVVDGVQVFNGNLGTIMSKGVARVCSGLPYGTHVVRFRKTSAGSGLSFNDFAVYGPKKPSIPDNAVELCEYYLVANYSGTGITGTNVDANVQIAQGVISKSPGREWMYTGANWAIGNGPSSYPLFGFTTGVLANNNQPAEYTFTGTGFVTQLITHNGQTYDFTIHVDGVLNATGVARSNATNLTGGSYRSTAGATGNEPVRIEFTGLTYGQHTVRITRTAGVGNLAIAGIHIITPVHFPNRHKPGNLSKCPDILNQKIVKDGRELKAKAWAVIGSQKIIKSYNIAGMLRTGTGLYHFFFEKPFKDSKYFAAYNGDFSQNFLQGGESQHRPHFYVANITNTTGGFGDPGFATIIFFGDTEDEQ